MDPPLTQINFELNGPAKNHIIKFLNESTGRIKNYVYNEATDCFEPTELDTNAGEQELSEVADLEKERFALDSDLTPIELIQCEHDESLIFSAFNHFNKTEGFYVYNSFTNHIHEHVGCKTCPRAPIVLNQLIGSPQDPLLIALKINREGRLIKGNEFDEFGPSKILKENERKHEHVQMLSMIEQLKFNLNTHNLILNDQLKKKRKRVSELEQALRKRNMKSELATDFDLYPKYINFCPHTNHFFITAYNNVSKRIGHYVFNQKFGQLHKQHYCPKCTLFDKGNRVNAEQVIMPVVTSSGEWPIVLCTDKEGRLCRDSFLKPEGTFLKVPGQTLGATMDINEINTSLKADVVREPIRTNDVTLYPKYSFYCDHVKSIIINALNEETEGYYYYNHTSGIIEEHENCEDCRGVYPIHNLSHRLVIMSARSPFYSPPILLMINKIGELVIRVFHFKSSRFTLVRPLVFLKKECETYVQNSKKELVLVLHKAMKQDPSLLDTCIKRCQFPHQFVDVNPGDVTNMVIAQVHEEIDGLKDPELDEICLKTCQFVFENMKPDDSAEKQVESSEEPANPMDIEQSEKDSVEDLEASRDCNHKPDVQEDASSDGTEQDSDLDDDISVISGAGSSDSGLSDLNEDLKAMGMNIPENQ